MKNSKSGRRGSALIICLVAVTMMVGLSGAFMMTSEGQLRGSTQSFENESAVQLADAGLSLSMDEIFQGQDGNISQTLGRGTITTVAVDNGDNTFTVTSTGVIGAARRTIEAVVDNTPGTPLVGAGIAAVVAKGDIPLFGNIQIDGRDFSATDATDIPLNGGVLGIFDEGLVTSMGSNTIGGNGIAPIHDTADNYESSGVSDMNGSFVNGSDEDGDGIADEEVWDGIDNDGDGIVDEDVNSFPTGPDAYFHQPDGTLKARAQMDGTYFATQSDFDAWKAANAAAGLLPVPGGSLVYLEFDTWGPPSDLNTAPDPLFPGNPTAIPVSILEATAKAHPELVAEGLQTLCMQAVLDQPGSVLIQHTSTSSAQMMNMHGYFKGAILGDQMNHFNANTEVRGTIVSFGNQVGGNAFGNGTAQLRFSSAALGGLPAVGTPAIYLRSWRQVVTTGM